MHQKIAIQKRPTSRPPAFVRLSTKAGPFPTNYLERLKTPKIGQCSYFGKYKTFIYTFTHRSTSRLLHIASTWQVCATPRQHPPLENEFVFTPPWCIHVAYREHLQHANTLSMVPQSRPSSMVCSQMVIFCWWKFILAKYIHITATSPQGYGEHKRHEVDTYPG